MVPITIGRLLKFNRDGDGIEANYSCQFDVASNQQIKEIITKHIYKMIKEKPGADDFTMYNKEGTLYNNLSLVARVVVGFRGDSFQVKWVSKAIFEQTGLKTEDVDGAPCRICEVVSLIVFSKTSQFMTSPTTQTSGNHRWISSAKHDKRPNARESIKYRMFYKGLFLKLRIISE